MLQAAVTANLGEQSPDRARYSAGEDCDKTVWGVRKAQSMKLRRSSHLKGSTFKEATCPQDEGFLAKLWGD
jgi:hypothetical protein